MSDSGNDVDRRVRQLQLISGALMGGVLLYTVVAVVLVSRGAMGSGPGLGVEVLGTVALVALGLLLLAPVLRTRVLAAGRSKNTDEVLARWSSATITGMAVREAAGLLGVTISLVATSVPWILAFGLASLAAMGLAWPRGDELRQRMRRLEAEM